MDFKDLLYLAALIAFSMGCRTFANRFIQKLGWLSLLGASYFAGWRLTGSHAGGVGAVLVWFLLPWLEIIGRIRHMRFPLQNSVSHRFPPSRDDFPDLEALTAEIEEEGFEEAEDTGWKWQETDHFMRLLYDPERRLQATIALARQGPMAFSYVSLTSRLPDGESLITTSYPFSPTMRLAPGQRMNRMPQADSFEDLLDGHLLFLEAQSLTAEDTVEQDLETLPTILEEDMTRQIRHNLSTGLIEQTSEEEFRYSWRGCFFLWIEVVKDMLRV